MKVTDNSPVINYNKTNKNLPSKEQQKLQKTVQEFSAVFLSKMLHSMYEGVSNPDPIFGGGSAEKTFRSMQLDEYAKIMSKQDVLGLETHLKEKLMRSNNAK